LDFALETKVPGKRPAGLSRQAFKDKVIDMMLKMFNIEHTRNTIVGNPFVRGVSGGERKRVSIAETMITGASLMSWDNSTRGLDASTAVDYARSLRTLTNIYKTTTFVSLYQASENIYKCFDKVLVIDSGRQVYFGPADEARAYFEGLGFLEKPRQTTPDYLTGCTDKNEREYKSGRDETNTPSTPEQLAEAFNKSETASRLATEMTQYHAAMDQEKHVYDDFQSAVKEGKRHAGKKSVYSIPFHLQVWALAKRQFLLVLSPVVVFCSSLFCSTLSRLSPNSPVPCWVVRSSTNIVHLHFIDRRRYGLHRLELILSSPLHKSWYSPSSSTL
jgi:ATP-binding cassette subfamily G (WHITE) protein 2 (SNQ2)